MYVQLDTVPGGAVDPRSPLTNWALSPSCESEHCLHWVWAALGEDSTTVKNSATRWWRFRLSCPYSLLHFCSFRKQLCMAFVRPGLPNATHRNSHSSLSLTASHSSLFLGFPSNGAACYSITNILHSWFLYYTYHTLPPTQMYASSSLQILPSNVCCIVTASSPGTGKAHSSASALGFITPGFRKFFLCLP